MKTAMFAVPLSALQHHLYCPRQCALIHNEQVWADNQFTVEGQILHQKSNEGPDEHRAEGSILRHLHVASETWGLVGICDVVEKSKDGSLIPVEYKRGKPKAHRADEVQVCSQALCLEEMFAVNIPRAHLFYGKTRRRTKVLLDEELRALTLHTAQHVRQILENRITPKVSYDSRRCGSCSLLDLCQPKGMRLKRGVSFWFEKQLQEKDEVI